MKVYLDDERVTPAGFVRTYTAQETIDPLKANEGKVEVISLDHDLGDDPAVGNGYDVLLWLEEQVITNGFRPPDEVYIHLANSGAWQKMIAAVRSIKEAAKRHE